MSVLARVRAMLVQRWRLLPLALALLALALLAVPLAPQREADAQTPPQTLPPTAAGQPDFDTGRIIVRFAPGVVGAQRAALHSQFAATVIDSIPALTIEVVRIANPAVTQIVAAAYDRNPLVAFAEPDALMPFADGTVMPNEWFLDLQWQHFAIDSLKAWDHTTGGLITGPNALLITICDTGVSATHPDLMPNLRGDLGLNVVDDSDDWSPIHWHGTATAGAAAAAGNNGIGVAGVAWSAGIVPVRISNEIDGGAFFSDMAQCIVYGAGLGSTAINLSYQTYTQQLGGIISPTILDAAAIAEAAGSLLVVAAGNENKTPIKRLETDPANIFYVSSTAEGRIKSSFSNFGPYVDIAAPGSSIVTTFVTNCETGCGGTTEDIWVFTSGTSFSAPITAGAALLVQANAGGGLTPAQIRAALTGGACDLGAAGEDDIFGAGLLNVHNAVHGVSCSPDLAIQIADPAAVDFGVVDLGTTVTTPADAATLTVANIGTDAVDLVVQHFLPAGANCDGNVSTGPEWTAVVAGPTPGADQFALWAKLGAGLFVGVPPSGSAALGGPIATASDETLDIQLDMPSSSSFSGPCTTHILITAFAP